MEKVQEQEQTIEVFENDIQMYLTMFCEEQGIEDMSKEPQSKWNAALMYIKSNVFNNRDTLKYNGQLHGYINNNYNNQYNNLNNSNCNSYNIDMVNAVCDYYIYLCYLNNKECSLSGFSRLTGINIDTLIDWGNNINKLSSSGCEIYKKLMQNNEECLANKLYDGKNNPIGPIATLKHRHGWESPYFSDGNRQKQALTAADLPKLTTDFMQSAQIEDKS